MPGRESEPMDLETKKKAILDHEIHMANLLAAKIIYRPELSIWMILIPVVFVYYFWRLKKVASGRREFVRHWMRQRVVCIEEACRVAGGGRPDGIGRLIPEERVPPAARDAYVSWVECLLQHYTDLMSAEGGSWQELVQAAYRKRTNYLLFINQLNERERSLTAALVPGLEKETPAAGATVRLIDQWCRKLRRQDAERVFA